jgi:hypothetical protein
MLVVNAPVLRVWIVRFSSSGKDSYPKDRSEIGMVSFRRPLLVEPVGSPFWKIFWLDGRPTSFFRRTKTNLSLNK